MSIDPGYSCTITVSGGSEFIRQVGAPFATDIKSVLPADPEKMPDVFPCSPLVFNSVVTVLAIGATVFVASHLTKKVLDDVYSVLIQPRLKSFLEKVDAKLKQADVKGQKSFNQSIWYDEFQVLVSVTIQDDSFANISKRVDAVHGVHEQALEWIRKSGVQKPVHY